MRTNSRSRIDDIQDIQWLEHPVRQVISNHIMTRGEKGATISELGQETGLNPSLCAYHLKLMEAKGLVENSLSRIEGRRGYSFYTLAGRYHDLQAIGEELRAVVLADGKRALPDSIHVVSWSNLPRCFVYRRGVR